MNERIILYYQPKCRNCMDGVVPIPLSVNPNDEWKDCPDCDGKGYTNETMELWEKSDEYIVGENISWFESNKKDFLETSISEDSVVIPNSILLHITRGKKLAPNPQYIEFITIEECPECRGDWKDDIIATGERMICPSCNKGKIEVVTGKYIFKDGLKESK